MHKGFDDLSKIKLLTAVVVALSLICISLIGYILYEHFIQPRRNIFCFPPLSISDHKWTARDIFYDGQINWHHIGHTFEQSHWNEEEFVILEAAINSFVPFEDGFVPPWRNYQRQINQPLGYRPPERQWWEHPPVSGIRGIVPPFDITFMLSATKPYSELGWDGNRWQLFDMRETISFLFSEEYGAFAITRFGNIPRGNYCPALSFQFFHMDADAFLALFEIIEYNRDLPPPPLFLQRILTS